MPVRLLAVLASPYHESLPDMNENSPRLVLPGVYHSLQLVIGAIFLLTFSLSIYRLYAHPLRKVPGPFFARITEIWRTVHYFRGTWFDDILELHRKYGPVVRISPNEVSVVSPDLTKSVYSHGKGTLKVSLHLYFESDVQFS